MSEIGYVNEVDEKYAAVITDYKHSADSRIRVAFEFRFDTGAGEESCRRTWNGLAFADYFVDPLLPKLCAAIGVDFGGLEGNDIPILDIVGKKVAIAVGPFEKTPWWAMYSADSGHTYERRVLDLSSILDVISPPTPD